MRPNPPAALLLFALAFGAPAAVQAAEPTRAACEITRGSERISGECLFTPRKGGSFDIRMTGGSTVAGTGSLSLDVVSRGHGTLRAGDTRWGAVTRDAADPACWRGEGLGVCARAPGESAPQPAAPEPESAIDPAHKDAMGARCHMDYCRWVDQSPAREIGQGSAAVPGRLVEVMQSFAESRHPGGNYPDGPPKGLSWSRAQPVRYFCSTTRPAFRNDDGSWFVLPLPDVWGATEGVTITYLRACHPAATGKDPYAEPARLGYSAGKPAQDSYPDFDSLIRP